MVLPVIFRGCLSPNTHILKSAAKVRFFFQLCKKKVKKTWSQYKIIVLIILRFEVIVK